MQVASQQLLDAVDKAEKKLAIFNNTDKLPTVLSRIRKFFNSPYQYTIHNLIKLGLISSSDVTITTFWGKKMVLPISDENVVAPYYTGILGIIENSLTRYLIANLKENDIFYDLGANYGFYTGLASHLIKNGEIHSFEPSLLAFNYLQKNFSSDKKVFLNQCAVSDGSSQTLVFYDSSSKNKAAMGTIVKEVVQHNPFGYKEVSVPAISLDAYIKSHRPPTIMKIDVEGSESMVIKGASSLLEGGTVIAMEIWCTSHVYERTKEAIKLLQQKGYKAYKILPNGSLKYEENLNPIKEKVGQFNIYIFKRD